MKKKKTRQSREHTALVPIVVRPISDGATNRMEPVLPHDAGTPTTEAAWDAFHRRLTDTLLDLTEDEFVIIAAKRGNRFTQAMNQGSHGCRVEAACNGYIEDAFQLSAALHRHALQLGWLAPTMPPPDGDEPPDGSPNYYRDVPRPVPYATIAELMVRTLREVFGIRHPGELQYGAASTAGGALRFPGLGLKRGGA